MKMSESPDFDGVPKRRKGSPIFGSSTLITSAPNSASCVVQNGPEMKLDRSRTRMPWSGLMVEVAWLIERKLAPTLLRKQATTERVEGRTPLMQPVSEGP